MLEKTFCTKEMNKHSTGCNHSAHLTYARGSEASPCRANNSCCACTDEFQQLATALITSTAFASSMSLHGAGRRLLLGRHFLDLLCKADRTLDFLLCLSTSWAQGACRWLLR